MTTGYLTLILVRTILPLLIVRVLFRVNSGHVIVDTRYLDREVIPEGRKDEFMLIRPCVAFLIQQTTSNQRHTSFLSIRPFCNIDCVTAESSDSTIHVIALSGGNNSRFLAVNNNSDPSIAEGGSHWYILCPPI